jgi:hypothetical protein
MVRREESSRLRDEKLREELAIAKEEKRLAREEREMERELRDFDATEERVEHGIEEEWRREHWGHAPEHPTVWPNHKRQSRPDPTPGQDT